MNSWQQERSRLGVLERAHRDKRNRPPEIQKEIDELRASLRAHKLATHIREVVEAAPPLTADQIARLRDLLPPADGASVAKGGGDADAA